MLSIFYGENTLASRNALNAEVEKFRRAKPGGEIVRLNGDKITETELVEALEAPSLIAKARLVVIEGLLTRRQSNEKQKLIDLLLKGLSLRPQGESLLEKNVCLWEPKAVTARILQSLRGARHKAGDAAIPAGPINIQEFKLTRFLFRMLDSLRPGNGRQMLQLANETLKSDPAEVAILMLGRRVAQLLVAKSGVAGGFSGLADWQIQKLRQQAASWSEKQLIDFHRRLVGIDEAVKTGASGAELPTHLDILLLNL